MKGLLLDTNALVWFAAGAPMSQDSLAAIAEAQIDRRLFVSAISAWEVALALQKPRIERRPDIGGLDAAAWFKASIASSGARVINISAAIAAEAARVVSAYHVSDPGDCHIIATARCRRLTVLTRDSAMLALARKNTTALGAFPC